jgi:hypothetical protein
MGEKKTTPITIDDVEYVFEDMTQEQQLLVNHVADLDRKLASTQFQAQQLQVGKDAFVQLLKEKLAAPVEKAEVEVLQ